MNELKKLDAATLVIFGITGDLAKRKLLPSLYYLAKQKLLPDQLKVLGVSRSGTTVEAVIETIRQSVAKKNESIDEVALTRLQESIEIVNMDLLDTNAYVSLSGRLDAIEDEVGMCMSRLYYLAIPSQVFSPVIDQLGKGGLNHACKHGQLSRLLIEKPFGYDTASAEELIEQLHTYFKEEQIYRIDHYLAKETVQNILVFRFQNPLFQHAWDNKGISSIMITAAEEIDIEGRSTFYEQTGALRDFIQGHLLQLLALTTMDQPGDLSSDSIHREKLKLLRSITPIKPDMVQTQAIRGQYAGYKDEVDNPDSLTETYAALQLHIDSERWRNVPILLRTGKALEQNVVDISVVFSHKEDPMLTNILTLRIQPQAGISLQLEAKEPGFTNKTKTVHMDFCYDTSFEDNGGHPDAYERVLMDAFGGDSTLFTTADEALASWHIIENIIHEWSKDSIPLHTYDKGTWGPNAAAEFAETTGNPWLTENIMMCPINSRPLK